MKTFSCPACGAEVRFKSKSSVFGVCSFCSSTIVRHDVDLTGLGKMGELAEDMSSIKIGTTGVFENSRFEVIGRQKISWEHGSWNEWYLLFDDGREGWLADAQGNYMVSFQFQGDTELGTNSTLNLEQEISVDDVTYKVTDLKEVCCTGSEGELPVQALKGRTSKSADLCGPDGHFASIDFAPTEVRVFTGKYKDFDDFKFENLREIDGW